MSHYRAVAPEPPIAYGIDAENVWARVRSNPFRSGRPILSGARPTAEHARSIWPADQSLKPNARSRRWMHHLAAIIERGAPGYRHRTARLLRRRRSGRLRLHGWQRSRVWRAGHVRLRRRQRPRWDRPPSIAVAACELFVARATVETLRLKPCVHTAIGRGSFLPARGCRRERAGCPPPRRPRPAPRSPHRRRSRNIGPRY
jgi:hypothetical protein